MVGQRSGRTDGEGAGRRPGQDPPLPSTRLHRIGGPLRLHARGHGRRTVDPAPRPSLPLPRSGGAGGFPGGDAVFGVRGVSAARGGPRGQDAGGGRYRIPPRRAARGDRGGGLPGALRGKGPPCVPGAFHGGVGRLRTLRGRRILPRRPLLAGRTALPGVPVEHPGGPAERGGALQDAIGAVFVPASRAGCGHRGRPSRAEGVGEDAPPARVPPDTGVDQRIPLAGRRRIPRVAGTNTRSSPRFTISPRKVTELTPFGTSISNVPDSPRRSAPSPRNRDFGNTRFRSVLPSLYRNSAVTPMERRERSGISSPRLMIVPVRKSLPSSFRSRSASIRNALSDGTTIFTRVRKPSASHRRRTARRAGPTTFTHLPCSR